MRAERAFMGLATIAACSNLYEHRSEVHARSSKAPLRTPASADSEAQDWSRVWFHAIRKAGLSPVSRCAAHCANSLLTHRKINDVQASSGAQ